MDKSIAVVGLGYVGLPLALALGKKRTTIGLDLNESKLEDYRKGIDASGEANIAQFEAASYLEFTSDQSRLVEADVIIVVVPTPIDEARKPDLSPLESACRMVAKYMSAGSIVVFESTVYPGVTEEVCVPILEEGSGLKWLEGFNVGYSPERINPGDRVHRLETITKVVSGDTSETLSEVSKIYELVVDAGVHCASSIKVAEAAKVIENTQRDLNIALMNELSLIFHRLEIDTLDVLEAAGTKWNFLPFRPGLVGGHCIGVDPYYLTYKAQVIGHDPQVILAGRHINDGMGKYIAEQTVKRLIRLGHVVSGATVTILGLTFKENCPDLRNSRVVDIIRELQEYNCNVFVSDPRAGAEEARSEYNVDLVDWKDLPKSQAVILAVPHDEYRSMPTSDYLSILDKQSVLMDVKSSICRQEAQEAGIEIWRL